MYDESVARREGKLQSWNWNYSRNQTQVLSVCGHTFNPYAATTAP